LYCPRTCSLVGQLVLSLTIVLTHAIIPIAITSWTIPRTKLFSADRGRLSADFATLSCLRHQMEMVGSASFTDVAPKIRLRCMPSYVLHLSVRLKF
jgi:hypothetical protein